MFIRRIHENFIVWTLSNKIFREWFFLRLNIEIDESFFFKKMVHS